MCHRMIKNFHDRLQHDHQSHGSQISNTRSFKSCVYFTNWAVYEKKHFPCDIPYEYYSHIFYAFIAIDPLTGKLKFTDEWCDLQMPLKSLVPGETVSGNIQQLNQIKKLNRQLKVCMSIGGWGTHTQFEAVVQDPEKQHSFVKSVVEFVEKYHFDGVDIDWEYPKNLSQGKALANLLKDLRHALPPQRLLTIAAPGGNEHIKQLPIKVMDQYLSFWNLMAYDFSGLGWSEKVGYHSNLFGNNGDNDMCADSIVKAYTKHGVSPQKLVLGMPMYARIFSGVQEGHVGSKFAKTDKEDTLGYNKIKDILGNAKDQSILEHGFDVKKVAAFAYNLKTKQFITYDNVQSAKIKGSYVKLHELGGGMWWDSSGDRPISNNCKDNESLVYHFVDQLGGCKALEDSQNSLH